MDEQRTAVASVRRTAALVLVGVTSALALVLASTAAAVPAVAKTPTTATARFVNMAVTPDFPDGTPVDVYMATTVTSRPSNGGGKITAYKPAPKKLVSKLGFGAATKYLTAPIGAQFLVTAAGKSDVLASGGVDAGGNGYGTSDTYEIHTNGDAVTADSSSTTTTKGFGYMSPLSLTGYSELQDFTYSDGTGRPIKDAAVLLTHTGGITGADDDSTWQMGVVGKGCLPEFLTNGNEDSDFNPETLGVGSAGGLGIEYVASEPGSLELGLWKTDSGQTDCSGTPIATATANAAAGTRSYLYWYGPATSPKLLVISLAAPKGEKSATNASPDAYTGSASSGSSSGGSDDSSSSATSTSSTSSTTSTTSP